MDSVSNLGENSKPMVPQPQSASAMKYDPGGAALLDLMMEKLKITTDRALSRELLVDTATLSRIRNRRATVPAAMILRMLVVTEMTVHEVMEVLRTEPEPEMEAAPEQST